MPNVFYQPDHREIETPSQHTILETSLKNEIPHIHVCGGNARCSTCRVMVVEGYESLLPRNEKEQAMADRLHFPPNIRLACQTPVSADIALRRLVLDEEDIAVTEQHGSKDNSTAHLGSAGVEMHMAVMFADIRNFTRFSESHVPYDVVHLLNRYFHRIGGVIRRNHGYIDNYLGDGIMALFGVEGHEATAAYDAVKAGLEMLEAVEEMRPYVQEVHNWDLEIGVGIHYGIVVVGSLGERGHNRETAIGDSVNFASRIESQNKEVGTRLLISRDTLLEMDCDVTIGQTCVVTIKGKSGEYTVYEVLDMK